MRSRQRFGLSTKTLASFAATLLRWPRRLCRVGRVSHLAVTAPLLGMVFPLCLCGSGARPLGFTHFNGNAAASCAPKLALGVHTTLAYVNAQTRNHEIVAARRLHARIVRTDLAWDRLEPSVGAIDWSVPDSFIDRLRRSGIEPMLVVLGSPPWANGVSMSVPKHALYVPTRPEAFDRWLARYARFIQQAAERYRGRVTRWEIWNEPNLTAFWKPAPNVRQYARVYRVLASAIARVNPGAKVAVGGLTTLSRTWGARDISGLAFLRRLLSRGMRPKFIALHSYTTPPHSPDLDLPGQNNFEDIARVHQLLIQTHALSTLWITEWGWSSKAVGVSEQARYVKRALIILKTQFPYITVAVYFLERDDPPRYYEGLLNSHFKRKPAASVFAAAAAELARSAPCTKVDRTTTGR
jgi:polysaccharide biosynthesis protein PslG